MGKQEFTIEKVDEGCEVCEVSSAFGPEAPAINVYDRLFIGGMVHGLTRSSIKVCETHANSIKLATAFYSKAAHQETAGPVGQG